MILIAQSIAFIRKTFIVARLNSIKITTILSKNFNNFNAIKVDKKPLQRIRFAKYSRFSFFQNAVLILKAKKIPKLTDH